MDSSQDFESPPGDVVTWVPSQTPNVALRELLREAENERRTRPSTPVHAPMSWIYPLVSTTLSTSVSSAWHSSRQNSTDLSLSGSGSSASSSPLVPRASEPSISRRAHPNSAPQRQPLATSTSSTNRPPRHSARPRSSSHSTGSSKRKYTPKDDEPEALFFIELLKDASRQVDTNSEKKERAAREKEKGKEKERDHSLARNRVDNRTGLHTNSSSAQPLTKTSSAFSISTKVPQKTLSASVSAGKPEISGRALAKMASLGAPSVRLVSGKSTPTSLPSPNLNYDPKPVPAPRPSAGSSNSSNPNHSTAHKPGFPKTTSIDDDDEMQGVIDFTDTDTESERPASGPISRADTTMFMQVDDEESDMEMDVSFFKPEPAPQTRLPAPKPKLQPTQPSRSSASAQRTSTGLPPLGMRRAPQLQPSQYSSTQGPKGVTVPRFKPPLLATAGGTTHRSGSGSKPATAATGSRPPPTRGYTSKVPVTETVSRTNQDPDSSFDISFGVDVDALEEAMKAYD